LKTRLNQHQLKQTTVYDNTAYTVKQTSLYLYNTSHLYDGTNTSFYFHFISIIDRW